MGCVTAAAAELVAAGAESCLGKGMLSLERMVVNQSRMVDMAENCLLRWLFLPPSNSQHSGERSNYMASVMLGPTADPFLNRNPLALAPIKFMQHTSFFLSEADGSEDQQAAARHNQVDGNVRIQ